MFLFGLTKNTSFISLSHSLSSTISLSWDAFWRWAFFLELILSFERRDKTLLASTLSPLAGWVNTHIYPAVDLVESTRLVLVRVKERTLSFLSGIWTHLGLLMSILAICCQVALRFRIYLWRLLLSHLALGEFR